jgi:mRNA-degrading endonuclease RelE of RelBE toxin-antitoxin system
MSYEVVLCDSFKRAVKQFKKRYPNVTSDVSRAIQQLQDTPDAGDVIRGGKGTRKFRVENSDINKGKSGGYRMLYYVVDHPANVIYMITLYAKSDREDIPKNEVIELLKAAQLI